MSADYYDPAKIRKEVVLTISDLDIEDVAEHAAMNIGSHEYRGQPPHEQPPEWHQGKRLAALVERMREVFREGIPDAKP